jgi:phage terminase small subunit
MTIAPKQQRFVDEYLIDLNATQAAIRAGYSAKTAGSQAFDLLKKPEIQGAISARQQERQKRTEVTQDRVLQEVARLAFLDIRKVLTDGGNLKPISELDDDTAAAIAGLEIMEEHQGSGADRVFIGYTKKLKLSDKKGALELLMRHLGMLKDRTEISGPNGGPIQTESRKLQDLTDDELLALATGRGEGASNPA